MILFEQVLRKALSLDLPYEGRAQSVHLDPSKKLASVLMLLGWSNETKFSSELHPDQRNCRPLLLFIKRTERSNDSHGGQMAFPGGKCEWDEIQNNQLDKTALRETEEEVGIPPHQISLLGRLPLVSTMTGFDVSPFVGVLKSKVEDNPLLVNSQEIDEAIWIPWEVLLEPKIYQKEMFQIGAVRYPIHVFQVGKYRIWGATGSMLKNLIDRCSIVMNH